MDTTTVHQATTTIPAIAAQTRGLTKVYGSGEMQVHALAGVDLTIESGRFTAIMGPSGSGKSTLMHCLAGLDQATSGEVQVGDQMLSSLSDGELTRFRRHHVGFVFQAFNLLPMLTAKQNMLLPLDLAGADPDWEWFDELVTVLAIGDRLGHRPSQLSGGQQQRVAIARALMNQPRIVFADEPTGNLDSRTSAEVLEFLRRSARELGQTTVMVTHEPSAAAYADRVVLIADGRVAGHLDSPTQDGILDALRQIGA
ncbi:MAG: putative transport system ATP-binding protein [Nocardioidaceae bacterium]|jgi:putative ABC transport system ATP-binding protein|nr:putative transport system ATP-binding protein [Nocardioidaceae bacterium]